MILASASPRRAELLRSAGISFEVRPIELDERFLPGETPQQAVARLAEAKAVAVAVALADEGVVVLAADTTVVIGGEALGKPADATDARRMLGLLSGRTHEVLTGVCLRTQGRSLLHVESTRVSLATMSGAEIDWYVGTGEPADKAGAYAIQGLASRFVEGIEGSYSNVVGLPISRVYGLLKALGCGILGT